MHDRVEHHRPIAVKVANQHLNWLIALTLIHGHEPPIVGVFAMFHLLLFISILDELIGGGRTKADDVTEGGAHFVLLIVIFVAGYLYISESLA